MKFYSDVTRQFYESEKECVKAEKEANVLAEKKRQEELAKTADRKAAADKVEAARKTAVEANKAYKQALSEFCSKYGTFHNTYNINDIDDLFDWFFRF